MAMLTVPFGAAGLAALAPGLELAAGAAVAGAPPRPLHAAAIATTATSAATRASGVVVLLLTVFPSSSAGAGLPRRPSCPARIARDLPRLMLSGAAAGRWFGARHHAPLHAVCERRVARACPSPCCAPQLRPARARALGDPVEHDPEQHDADPGGEALAEVLVLGETGDDVVVE